MKKIVKWVLIGIVAVITLAGSAYYMMMPVTVSAVKLEAQTAEQYFLEQGIADVERTVAVYATVPGRLESVYISENQTVSEGDVLCVVDTSDLLFQIAQTKSSMMGYQAQLDNLDIEEQRSRDSLTTSKNSLQGELKALSAQEKAGNAATDEQVRLQSILIAQNEKDLARAREDLGKAELLYEMGIMSVTDYEQTQKAVDTQESILAQNLQQLQIIESGGEQGGSDYYKAARESLQAQINGIDQSLSKSYTSAMKDYYRALIDGGQAAVLQLEKHIADSTVTAPVSGVVTTLNVKDTNIVGQQTPVAVITPDTTSQIEVYVSTNDIDEVYIGQEVALILKRRGGDKTYPGVIKGIDDEATVRLSVLGVEERRVKVTVAPTEGQDEIKKGFDVDVKFISYSEANKLTVPKTAFFMVNDRDRVWVIRDGKAVVAEVTKGRELRTDFVVETGLSVGDVVIIDANNDALKEGANVKAD